MISQYDFFKWQAKAPVDIVGAQHVAKGIWKRLKKHLTVEERQVVKTALSHALDTKEGRDEFDRIADEIRHRLFKGKMRPGINLQTTWGNKR